MGSHRRTHRTIANRGEYAFSVLVKFRLSSSRRTTKYHARIADQSLDVNLQARNKSCPSVPLEKGERRTKKRKSGKEGPYYLLLTSPKQRHQPFASLRARVMDEFRVFANKRINQMTQRSISVEVRRALVRSTLSPLRLGEQARAATAKTESVCPHGSICHSAYLSLPLLLFRFSPPPPPSYCTAIVNVVKTESSGRHGRF